jgi:hypothetical protein
LSPTATSLAVGTLNPGATATQTVYIKNTGNIPETLTMTVNNWNPANANTYLTLTWNRQNNVLAAGASIQATLTLTATANTGSLTTFSCDVTLTGVLENGDGIKEEEIYSFGYLCICCGYAALGKGNVGKFKCKTW